MTCNTAVGETVVGKTPDQFDWQVSSQKQKRSFHNSTGE